MEGICKGKMEKETENVGLLFPHLYEGICIKDLPQCILPVLIGKGSKDLSSAEWESTGCMSSLSISHAW